MKNQRKNSVTIFMILSLLAMFVSLPTFADDSETSTIEDTSTTSSPAYISDEEEAPSTTTTIEEEEDTSVINSADSDSDI
ncbi:hypothetical protein [Halobacteriovorax sp. JY17]|uniref:hypothetical protein n=1 Tax=Halobacteriovorax sp. JY17 TaxID=2014617 RepID=UPI000C388D64|nr:hypothetical protein [Halobacteriovorax sp. JY17]PIK14844.1 MAG: hypothetical protein CES88_10945 [Halobacteriovorax sp. JY17]